MIPDSVRKLTKAHQSYKNAIIGQKCAIITKISKTGHISTNLTNYTKSKFCIIISSKIAKKGRMFVKSHSHHKIHNGKPTFVGLPYVLYFYALNVLTIFSTNTAETFVFLLEVLTLSMRSSLYLTSSNGSSTGAFVHAERCIAFESISPLIPS